MDLRHGTSPPERPSEEAQGGPLFDPVDLAREGLEVPPQPDLFCNVCAKGGKRVPGPFMVLGGSFCRRHGLMFAKQLRRRAKRFQHRMDIPKEKR